MNIFLLKISLFLFSLLFVINPVSAKESKFYHINLLYDKGNIELKNIAVLPGEISQVPQEGEYIVELISGVGTTLYIDHFQIPLTIHGEEIDPETGEFTSISVNLDSTEIVLNIPFFPDGKVINIYDSQNTKVLEIPVEGFSKAPDISSKTSFFDKANTKIFLTLIIGGLVVLGTFFVTARIRKRL
ncbi:MAG: hypothetical protein HYT07_04225 [Candidatus Levybacteria bacterium]|nr:hypothetical protein [Candidatus Levybacteria bacterium]